MKKSLLLLAVLVSFIGNAQDMKINAVFDGTKPGGGPKFVEFYVINAIADLSTYGFGSANNAGGTDGVEFTFPAVAANAGDYIIVVNPGNNGLTLFSNYFGFPATYDSGASNINGDDSIELFSGPAGAPDTVVDVYGVVGTDGSGEVWEYSDSFAHRNNGAAPTTTFNPADWTFTAINTLDVCNGAETNGTCTAAGGAEFPINTLPVELQNFSVE